MKNTPQFEPTASIDEMEANLNKLTELRQKAERAARSSMDYARDSYINPYETFGYSGGGEGVNPAMFEQEAMEFGIEANGYLAQINELKAILISAYRDRLNNLQGCVHQSNAMAHDSATATEYVNGYFDDSDKFKAELEVAEARLAELETNK